MTQSSHHAYICVGAITAPHGVRGEVKIRSFTENPEDLTAYGPLYNHTGTKTYKLRIKHQRETTLIAAIDGCTDRNSAEQLRGVKLYIARDQLPETDDGEFYMEDLLNLEVRDVEGEAIGTVKSVQNYGSCDLVEIEMVSGKTEFFPFTDAIFPTVNLAEKVIILHRPDEVIADEHHA